MKDKMKNEIKKKIKELNILKLYGFFKKKENSKYKEFVLENTRNIDTENFMERLYLFYNGYIEKQICSNINCNNFVQFLSFSKGYREYCSVKCKNSSKLNKEKIKKTNLKKYGVENPFSSNKIKEKIKQSNLKKYGETNYTKTEEYKEKVRKTLFNKYNQNIENSFQLDFVIDKIKIKNKKNNREKYFLYFKEKLKEFHLEILCEKEKFDNADFQTNIHKYRKEGYIYYDFKCLKCNNVFSSHLSSGNIPICRKCNPITYSNLQNDINLFIESLNVNNISFNNRNIISPMELDIFIKDFNFAIEVNGMYWHSYEYINEYKISNNTLNKLKEKKINTNIGENYHLLKTTLCKDKKIQLFHIFEYEWNNPLKQNILKSMIKNKLKLNNNKIFARKCIIKELNTKEDNILVRNFLNKNHIQGTVNSSIKLGIFFNDELVSLMTFSKERVKTKNKYNNTYELTRFCSKLNTNIIGGASKLLKYFVNKILKENERIITFADLRYSYGDLYYKLGFKKLYITQPNYYYFKNSYPKNIQEYSNVFWKKENFRKEKIKKMFEDKNNKLIHYFNDNLTEKENMVLNNFSKIYDSGKIKFEYIKENNK